MNMDPCFRCEASEATLQCADCPNEGGSLVLLCEECSNLVHIGKFARHRITSALMKEKKIETKAKLVNYEKNIKMVNDKLEEMNYLHKDLQEIYRLHERNIRCRVIELQELLKKRAMDLIQDLQEFVGNKTKQITESQEALIKQRDAMKLCQGEIQEIVILDDSTFAQKAKDDNCIIHHQWTMPDMNQIHLPSIFMDVHVDFSEVSSQIQNLRLEIQDLDDKKHLQLEGPKFEPDEEIEVMLCSSLQKNGTFSVSPLFQEDVIITMNQISVLIRLELLKDLGWCTYADVGTLPGEAEHVCAQHPTDNKWYRASIIHAAKPPMNKSLVMFLDYGNMMLLGPDKLVPFRNVAPDCANQAMVCSLFPGKEYTIQREAIWVFHDYTQKCRLFCKLMSKKDGVNTWHVELYSQNGEGAERILVNEKLAEFVHEGAEDKPTIGCRDIRYQHEKANVVLVEAKASPSRPTNIHDSKASENQTPKSDVQIQEEKSDIKSEAVEDTVVAVDHVVDDMVTCAKGADTNELNNVNCSKDMMAEDHNLVDAAVSTSDDVKSQVTTKKQEDTSVIIQEQTISESTSLEITEIINSVQDEEVNNSDFGLKKLEEKTQNDIDLKQSEAQSEDLLISDTTQLEDKSQENIIDSQTSCKLLNEDEPMCEADRVNTECEAVQPDDMVDKVSPRSYVCDLIQETTPPNDKSSHDVKYKQEAESSKALSDIDKNKTEDVIIVDRSVDTGTKEPIDISQLDESADSAVVDHQANAVVDVQSSVNGFPIERNKNTGDKPCEGTGEISPALDQGPRKTCQYVPPPPPPTEYVPPSQIVPPASLSNSYTISHASDSAAPRSLTDSQVIMSPSVESGGSALAALSDSEPDALDPGPPVGEVPSMCTGEQAEGCQSVMTRRSETTVRQKTVISHPPGSLILPPPTTGSSHLDSSPHPKLDRRNSTEKRETRVLQRNIVSSSGADGVVSPLRQASAADPTLGSSPNTKLQQLIDQLPSPDRKTEFSGHLVSELDDKGKFWLKLCGQNRKEQDAIARLTRNIQEFARLMTTISKPELGDMVLAKHKDLWQRAYVKEIQANKAVLFLVDLGFQASVPIGNLRSMLKSFQQIPKQAVQCCIANHHYTQFSNPVCKLFNNICKGKELQAHVVQMGQDTHREYFYFVRLFANIGGTAKNIYDMLCDKDPSLLMQPVPPPDLSRLPPNYMPPQQYYLPHIPAPPPWTDGSHPYDQTAESYHLMMQAIATQGQPHRDITPYVQEQGMACAGGGDYIQDGVHHIPVNSQMSGPHQQVLYRQTEEPVMQTQNRLPSVPQKVDPACQQVKKHHVQVKRNQGKLHVHSQTPSHPVKSQSAPGPSKQHAKPLPEDPSSIPDQSHSSKCTGFQPASSQQVTSEVTASNPESAFDEGAWLEDASETVSVPKVWSDDGERSGRPKPAGQHHNGTPKGSGQHYSSGEWACYNCHGFGHKAINCPNSKGHRQPRGDGPRRNNQRR